MACRLIDGTDWDSILVGNDIDLVAQNWTDKFLSIMEQCIPHRVLRKRRNLPWLTKSIVQLIRKCNILFKRAKKSGKQVHFCQYKTVRNKIVCLLRSSKKQHFSNLANASDKEFWKSVRLLKNRTLSHLSTPMEILSLMTSKKLKFLMTSLKAVGTLWNSL